MAKLNPESAWEFADAIRAITKQPTTRRKATVQSVDKDGTIWVNLPGSSTVTPIQSTGANVSPGDTVLTELRGTSLHITENQTNPAIGENTARSIARQETQHAEAMAKQAQTIADEANAVAQATNQRFFADDNGAHITDVTQDEWTQAVADEFSDYDPTTKPYHNQLLNSLGILLRTALNNLVSITRSAIAFYDGTGNTASNIVARFGSSGAQIGKSGESHVLVNSDSLTIANQNGAELFDVDMDVGTLVTTAALCQARSSGNAQKLTEIRAYTHTYTFTADIAPQTGETFWIPAGANICNAVMKTDGAVLYPVSVSTASGIAYTRNNGHMVFKTADAITFTGGTPSTVTLTASGSRGGSTYAYSLSLESVIKYLATEKLQVKTTLTITVSSYGASGGYYNCSYNLHQPSAKHTLLTTGAGFTFGTRQEESTVGILSAAIGEGLIASQQRQTAAGAYNLEDTNGDYALIIGNGTADDARSNALAVTWDGDIECATDTAWITLNGAIKYRIHHGVCYVCGDSASGGTSVGTSGTNVGTLPVGARPSVTVTGAASTKSNAANGQFSIDSSGVIKVWNLQTSSPYWCFTAAFPVG